MEDTYSHITPMHRLLIAGSIMIATMLQMIDTTIAMVALPKMQGEMSATQEQMSWVLTSYIVAAAITTPTAGVLSAMFGRKNVLVVSVAGFTLASAMCGLATNVPEIVAFRLLQGMFGASLVPLSQATLLDSFPPKSHGPAMAAWSVGVTLGPILGPTLGGYLTEYYSWRWVFYINLPLGLLALIGILSVVPNTLKDASRRFDFFGFALLGIAIASFQLMLDRGQSRDWFSSPEIVTEAVLCGLFLYLFLVHIFTAKDPFIEPRLFRNRNFLVGLFFISVLGSALMSSMSLISPFLQQLLDFPVLTAGFVMAPRSLGTVTAMIVAGRLVGRVDNRLITAVGVVVTALALGLMSRYTLDVSFTTLVWTGFLQGLGMGCIFVPITTSTFSTLAPRFRTEGAVMFSLIRNIGSSAGISIMMTVLAQTIQATHADIAGGMTPFRDMMQMPNLPQMWDWHNTAGAMALNGEVTRQATHVGYLRAFSVLMWMHLIALPMVLLISPGRHDQQTETEPELKIIEA